MVAAQEFSGPPQGGIAYRHGAEEQQASLPDHWFCFLLPSSNLQGSSSFRGSLGLSPQSLNPAGRSRHFPGQSFPGLPHFATVLHSFSGGREGERTHLTFYPWYCVKYIYCIYKRPDLVYPCLIYSCACQRPQRKPVLSLGGMQSSSPGNASFWEGARLAAIAEGRLWGPLPPPPPDRELTTTLSLSWGKGPDAPPPNRSGRCCVSLW